MNCTTCNRRSNDPYRVFNERGKVIAGCVDECHTGQLITPSESSWWHTKKEAKAIRIATKQFKSK